MIAFQSMHNFWLKVITPSVIAAKSTILKSLLAGVANFIAVDLITDKTPLAITVSVLSVMATAYFSNKPKVIAAQAAREATRHLNTENSNAALIERMSMLHREDIQGKQKTIEILLTKIDLIRISKHNALGQLQAAYWYIDEVGKIAAMHQLVLPEFQKAALSQIFGEEDEKLRLLYERQLNSEQFPTSRLG